MLSAFVDKLRVAGAIVTREMVLKAAGFDPVKDTRSSLAVIRDAFEAGDDEGPDHPTRLKAAALMLGVADVLQPGRAGITASITGPVSITWVTPSSSIPDTSSPSRTLPAHSRPSSMTPSIDSDPARPASSAIDDLERL